MKDSARSRLRQLMSREEIVICPGVFSPLFAKLVEAAGFDVVYATGAGISNAVYGLPDLGLIGMREVVDVVSTIAASTDLPVIADADTGYGGSLNVVRTVRLLESRGVAGIQIEDQVQPKRCGHFDGKEVVSTSEMVERLVAAQEARRDPDLLLIARTDARATEGLDAAIERALAYEQAGADVIFVEAPRSVEELAAIPQHFGVPVMVNLVEGAKTPLLPKEELQDMGYQLVLYANAVMRSAMFGAQRTLETLRDTGSTLSVLDQMVTFQDRQAVVGLDEWLALDTSIAASSRELVQRPHEGRRPRVDEGR